MTDVRAAPPRVLTVAGSDSGGGAGIQADLKTMTMIGVHAMSVVTAVTAQNSVGVQGYWELPTDAIDAQLSSVLEDIGVDAVKTGMLATADIVTTVVKHLQLVDAPVVVDPVCVSKHGDPLVSDDALAAIRTELLPHAFVLTPNASEAQRLSGVDVVDSATQRRAADALLALGPTWVVVKGGHLAGAAVDLVTDGETTFELTAPRLDNRHTHGTGCTLASAIAAHLALGDDVPVAIGKAKEFVTEGIRHGYALGRGIGPVDHAWKLR